LPSRAPTLNPGGRTCKLLQALALQIGNEVSYNELADMIGINKNTVANYIQILEKAFIIFRLKPYSKNLRNELKKLRKIYFYDTGIRNVLINNLNPLNLRQDIGSLWENFMISERLKYNSNNNKDKQVYFWRTLQQQEIDYIEEYNGKLSGFELKWKKDKFKKNQTFLNAYKGSSIELINKDNYKSFAASYAGADIAGKDDNYFVNVGLYMNIDEYNKIKELERSYADVYNANYAWQWESQSERKEFRRMWKSSENAYNNIRFAAGALILNRIASAINAVRLVSRYNKNLSNDLSWNVNFDYVNTVALPNTIRFNFVSSF